jgi:hypothetical protein
VTDELDLVYEEHKEKEVADQSLSQVLGDACRSSILLEVNSSSINKVAFVSNDFFTSAQSISKGSTFERANEESPCSCLGDGYSVANIFENKPSLRKLKSHQHSFVSSENGLPLKKEFIEMLEQKWLTPYFLNNNTKLKFSEEEE